MKSKKRLGLGYVVVALLFLFNPNVAIVDPLPDFIGYVFLCLAFSKLADLNDTLSIALKGFRKMILIDACKWLAILWVFGLSAVNEQNTSLLLWSFVFSVVEMIFLIPAYSKLFGGLTELGYFHENTAIFGKNAAKRKKTPTDWVRILTIAFVIVKATLSALPEFADLTNSMYDEGGGMIHLYHYIGLMRVMAFIPVLILGTVWMIVAQIYFGKLRKDQILMEGLLKRYDETVRPKKGLFARRSFRTFSALFVIALLFTVDFRVGSIDVLPELLAPLFFIISMIALRSRIPIRIGGWLTVNILYAVSTLLTTASEWYFFSEFYYGAIYKSIDAMRAYNVVFLCNLLQLVLFFFLLFIIYRTLRVVIVAHTGYVEGRERAGLQEERMVDALQGELKGYLVYALIGAIFYVVADVAFLVFAPSFGFMSMIHVLGAAACIFLFVKAFSGIQHAMDTKYMLE